MAILRTSYVVDRIIYEEFGESRKEGEKKMETNK